MFKIRKTFWIVWRKNEDNASLLGMIFCQWMILELGLYILKIQKGIEYAFRKLETGELNLDEYKEKTKQCAKDLLDYWGNGKKICHLTIAIRERIPRLMRESMSSKKYGFKNYIICIGKNEENESSTIIGVKSPVNRVDRILRISREVYKRSIDTDADIYQIHDPELLRFTKRLKRKGKIVIFDSHENYLSAIADRKWIPTILRAPITFIFKWYMKSLLPQVDAVLAVNKPIQDSLKRFNPNTHLVTNYPVLRERKNMVIDKSEGFNLCYTGGVSGQWSLKDIIIAISDLEEVNFAFCGVDAEGYIDELRKLPEWKDEYYRGVKTAEKALQFQEKSSVGLAILKYSSNTNGKYGTMGNTKLFEYLMSGIPVICTDFTTWREVVEKYQCGICVDPNSISQIRDAIIRLRDNPDLTAKMGENARLAAEKEYNWKEQESSLLNVYKKYGKLH